jgi:hypothetical protein
MTRSMIRAGALFLVFVGIAFSDRSSQAIDGVVEVNQVVALAGAVNGDLVADPAGFPVLITQPGR